MKLSTLVLLVFGGLFLPVVSQAQTEPPPAEGFDRALRFSLIQFLDPVVPGPQVSYEQRIRNNSYLRFQMGWLMDFGYNFQEPVQDLQGFRLRASHRKYVSNPGKIVKRRFREFSFGYRFVEAQVIDRFDLGQLGNAFEQDLPYGTKRHSFDLAYLRGISITLNSKGNWHLDLGLGMGIQYAKYEYDEIAQGVKPDSGDEPFFFDINIWDYNHRDGGTFGISMPVIGALGYSF